MKAILRKEGLHYIGTGGLARGGGVVVCAACVLGTPEGLGGISPLLFGAGVGLIGRRCEGELGALPPTPHGPSTGPCGVPPEVFLAR